MLKFFWCCCILLYTTRKTVHSRKAQNALGYCDADKTLCHLKVCPKDYCIPYGPTSVRCETSDPKLIIPRNLKPSTTSLLLRYTGPLADLTPHTFEYLMNLTDVTICGNISSLARNTFGYQPRLQNLYIRSTKLSYLPNRLFNNSYSIKLLNLAFNQFKELPVNIFQNILNIQHLDFSYNVIVGCSNSTIGPEFRNLSKLKTLELTSYGRNQTLCSSVGKDYLQPLEHVSDLYLSNSQIFYGDPRILSPLKIFNS